MSDHIFTRPRTPEQKPSVATEGPKDTPISQSRLANQVKHSINTDGAKGPTPAKFEKAEVVQERVHLEVSKSTMKDVVSLVDAMFPNLFLPFSSDQIDELLENDILRRNNEWTSWPTAKLSISEPGMMKFVNLIGETARQQFKTPSAPRYYSSMFYQHPIGGKEGEGRYKPDGIVIDSLNGCVLKVPEEEARLSVRWPVIEIIFEIKLDDLTEAIAQCSRYSQSVFNAQPGRHFVPAVVVVGTNVMLLLYDRSGLIRSEKINVHDDTHKFLRLILGILFIDREHLGFDSALEIRKGCGDEDGTYLKTLGVRYKVECIYREHGIKGRGTVCYRGQDPRDGSYVVIKDSWVDVSREETEVDILKKLNEDPEKLKTPDGVRVIPELVSHEIVMRKRPGKDPTKLELVRASTAIFREELVVKDDKGKPKYAWTSTDEEDRNEVEIRELSRVVMKPFGLKLETFPSKMVLMRAFGDIVHAIRILYELGIVHRDISFRNILLQEHGGTLRGLLIDYDYAVSLDRASSGAVAERTGTIPFMAMDRLQKKPDFSHNYFHDLESVFYVVCWMCTLYDGPHSQKRIFCEEELPYLNTSVAKWNGDTIVKKDFDSLFDSKRATAESKIGFYATMKQFAQYFEHFKPCTSDLQKLIFDCPFFDYARAELEKKSAEMKEQYLAASLEVRERMKTEYDKIPLAFRLPAVVFSSYLAIVDNAVRSQPKEEEMAPNMSEVAKGVTDKNGVRPRGVREYLNEDVVIAAAHVDYTHHEKSKDHVESRPSGVPPSLQQLLSQSQGNPFTSSSRTSQKRKTGGDSGTSSSKRSKSLKTPGNSTSEIIAGGSRPLTKAQRMKPKMRPQHPKGPVLAKEPDVFDENPSGGGRGGRSSSIIKGFVDEPNV